MPPRVGAGAVQSCRRLSRQETILNEAAARIRRHAGLPHTAPFDRPLIVVLSKLDEWNHLLDTDAKGDPWRTQDHVTGVDMDRIEHLSELLRRILLHYCPETVAAAESFTRDVTYIAVSSLGPDVQLDPATGLAAIRPADIQPTWVTAPLALLHLPGLVPAHPPVRQARKAGLKPCRVGETHQDLFSVDFTSLRDARIGRIRRDEIESASPGGWSRSGACRRPG